MAAFNGSGPNHLGVNLSFTKFLFITPRVNDEATRARLRVVGSAVARGFFNDFDSDSVRDPQAQPLETINFLAAATGRDDPHAPQAHPPYVAQVSAKYRPRLYEVEQELRRRVADLGDVTSLDGALRAPRYTSAELYAQVYKPAAARASGRIVRNAIILPIRKTEEWWAQSTLDRHAYFYPHVDGATGAHVKGHARAAEAGIGTIFRRLYHNPDGYQQPDQYDFITYFECADDQLPIFESICRALRDDRQNPEWRYVVEGPEWRGHRVMHW